MYPLSLTVNPTLYRASNPRDQNYSIEEYQSRTQHIALDHAQVNAAEKALREVLGEFALGIESVGEDYCRDLLEQFLQNKVSPEIRDALTRAGFKSVGKYSGYDYLRAKQKLIVLSDFFLRDRLRDPLNIAGNIKYRNRTERLEFSSLKKSQLYGKLEQLIQQVSVKAGKEFSPERSLSQLEDWQCRDVLRQFYQSLTASERIILNDNDLRPVTSVFYSSQRAKFKLLALWDTFKSSAQYHQNNFSATRYFHSSFDRYAEVGKFNGQSPVHLMMIKIACQVNVTQAPAATRFPSSSVVKNTQLLIEHLSSEREGGVQVDFDTGEKLRIFKRNFDGGKRVVISTRDGSGFVISLVVSAYKEFANLPDRTT